MERTLEEWIKEDKSTFVARKDLINEALVDLKTGMLDSVSEDNKSEVLYMLCFCLLVPQSKQLLAEEVIDNLKNMDYYENSIDLDSLKELLSRKIRFHNVKADRLEEARNKFVNGNLWNFIRSKSEEYHAADSIKAKTRILLYSRNCLTSEVDGMGLKLASHFLRNIGMRGLAILDVHVLRALEERKQIADYLPLNRDRYYNIEQKLKKYAALVDISLDELDQLFWSNATGYVGK